MPISLVSTWPAQVSAIGIIGSEIDPNWSSRAELTCCWLSILACHGFRIRYRSTTSSPI